MTNIDTYFRSFFKRYLYEEIVVNLDKNSERRKGSFFAGLSGNEQFRIFEARREKGPLQVNPSIRLALKSWLSSFVTSDGRPRARSVIFHQKYKLRWTILEVPRSILLFHFPYCFYVVQLQLHPQHIWFPDGSTPTGVPQTHTLRKDQLDVLTVFPGPSVYLWKMVPWNFPIRVCQIRLRRNYQSYNVNTQVNPP